MWENHVTKGNETALENIILSIARDVIFSKLVEVPWGKVILPDEKITSQANPQNKYVGNFTTQSQIFHYNK